MSEQRLLEAAKKKKNEGRSLGVMSGEVNSTKKGDL